MIEILMSNNFCVVEFNEFLNQARAWFLKIDPVRIVCMRACVCVRARGY